MSPGPSPLVRKQLDLYRRDPAMVLQMLRNVQLEQNYIGERDAVALAEALNIPRTKIQGLIDFYSFLHETPRGRYDVYFSDSITDHMLGSREVAQVLCDELEVELGVPHAEGLATVSATSCTGLCERGPAVIVNGIAIDRVDEQRAREMADLIRREVALEEWPLEWFVIGDTIRRKGPILETPLVPGAAIQRALQLGREETIKDLENSGLRGCGGAGFPTYLKWDLCRQSQRRQRYVVCNADEGEPGTFKDRTLLHRYADTLLEGMTVCAVTIGADKGFIYLRHEYEFLRDSLQRKIDRRRDAGLLGRSILGHHGIHFDVEIYMGAGSYVCGEESALIESLEGKRGIPRIRPPFPVSHGYLRRPTVVNNVETLCYAARVLEHSPSVLDHDGAVPGWKLLSISGDCEARGIFEIPLGTSIRDILGMCGAKEVQAVQVGGPAGVLISPSEFDRATSFDDLNTAGSFIVFDNSRDLLETAVNFTHFFAHESCGFCTPCRVGTKLISQLTDKVAEGHGARLDIEQMRRLNKLMTQASHCGLGQRAAVPVLATYEKFPESFERRMEDVEYKPAFDVEAAIQRSKEIVREEEASR